MKKLLSVLALVSWLLTACASPEAPAPAPPPTRIVVQPTTESQFQSAPSEAGAPAQTAEAQSVAQALDAAPTPTLRADFEATGPSTVVLAAGQPQLVEFFAFW